MYLLGGVNDVSVMQGVVAGSHHRGRQGRHFGNWNITVISVVITNHNTSKNLSNLSLYRHEQADARQRRQCRRQRRP